MPSSAARPESRSSNDEPDELNDELFEPVLRLGDDYSFFRHPGETFRRWKLARRISVIALLVILVYLRVMWAGGFVWHDQSLLNQMWSWSGLARLWTHGQGFYRPLSLTLLWVEHHFAGTDPTLYHCVSVALHACNCVLLWMVLRRLDVKGAWLAAALFAVHPVEVQSVAWISQQPHLVCATFFLWTIWMYLRLLRICPPVPEQITLYEHREIDDLIPPASFWRLYPLCLLSAAAAVLCDPTGVCLPIVLVLLIWWKRGSVSKLEWCRLTPFFLIAAVGAALILSRSSLASQDAGIAPSLTILQRFVVAGRAAWFYAINILRLYPRSFIYPRWGMAAWNAIFALGLLLAGIVVLTGRKRWGILPIILMFLFLTLLTPAVVEVMWESHPTVYIADYQEYLASTVLFGLAAALLIAAAGLFSSPTATRAARLAFAVVSLGLCAGLAVAQGWDYTDAETAWRMALARDSRNVVARTQYALSLVKKHLSEASRILSEADPADADDLAMLDARARVFAAQDRYDEALNGYLIAQRLAPDNEQIQVALAGAYEAAGVHDASEGNSQEAAESYQSAYDAYVAALNHDGLDESIYNGLGQVLLKEGRLDAAISQLDAALKLNPIYVPAKVNRAKAYFAKGMQGDSDDIHRAFAELKDAFAIEPNSVEACSAAASMHFQLRDFVQAEQYSQRAIEREPESADAWADLGSAQYAQKRFKDAMRSFDEALRLKPDCEPARRGKDLAAAKLARTGP
jgi:tetratricopeptide (TPR) repeat protein